MKPGRYANMPMADYLAIDALSATPARALIEQCPRAGWWQSKLNPNRPREVSAEMDVGSAAHSVFLENSWDCVVEIDPTQYLSKTNTVPKGWTNDAIKEARDNARAAGRYPVLKGGIGPIRDMVTVAREFVDSLRTTEPAVWRSFQDDGGLSEVVFVWDDDGVLCKCRVDRIAADYSIVTDYKTTAMSVEPDSFCRKQMYGDSGYAFGAAWYRRGIAAVSGVEPDYLWLAQETDAPHLCSIVGLTPDALALAEEKVNASLRKWRECLRTGQWDGYPNRVCYPELPVYERAKWDSRIVVTLDGIDYASQA